MDQFLINSKDVKRYKNIKQAGKLSAKYFDNNKNKMYKEQPKTKMKTELKKKIRKIFDISDISYVDLMPNLQKSESVEVTNKDELIKLCDKNNITGRSGNGFLISEKLKSYDASNGTLIVNAIECDPGLCHDAWIFRNRLSDVVEGIRLLDKIFGFGRKIIATKEPQLLNFPDVEQINTKDRFPLGYENYLIKSVLGIDLPKGSFPTQNGILVLNIQTVLAIFDAANGYNVSEFKYISVIDMLEAKGYAVKAPFGMDVNSVAKAVLGEKTATLYAGGGVTRCHKAHCDVVDGMLCFIASGFATDFSNAKKCTRCGRCSRNCPANVNVKEIVSALEKDRDCDKNELKKYNYEACVFCGLCTYNCLASKDARGFVLSLLD